MNPTPRSRRLLWVVATVTPILAATLLPVPADRSTRVAELTFCIPCGPSGTANAVENLLLFMPLGAALAHAGLRMPQVTLLSTLLSLSLEVAQLWIAGRHSNLGDVLTNGIGSAFGALLVLSASYWLGRSRGLSWVATAATAFALLATTYLLQPAPTRSIYYGHWTPQQRLEWYHGTVLDAHIGPIPLPSHAIKHSDAVRESILRGGEIRVTALAGPPIPRLGSLFQISDYKEREVILLGPDRDDLVFRYRTRANEHRLRSPEIRVPRAFAGVAPGDTILVTARLTLDGFCVALNQAARCPARLSVGTGWALLFYPGYARLGIARALDLLWIAGLCALAGFWSPSLGTAGAQSVLLLATLLGVRQLPGVVSAGIMEGSAVVVGLAVGALLQRVLGPWRRRLH